MITKKKLLTFIGAIIILISGLNPVPVFAQENSDVDYGFVDGYMYYSEMKSTVPTGIQVQYATNLDLLLSGDNTIYNKNLAVTAEILASDVYQNVKVGTSSNGYTDEECEDDLSIYSQFNMADVESIDLTGKYTNDPNDVTRFVVSHRNIVKEGKEKEIIVVAIEGTNSTSEQWNSNFDVGSSDESYPGQHDEWTNKNNHKGFDITYQRVLEKVNEYISSKVSSTAEKTILITGHSRGGAIANLLGKHFEEDSNFKSFTYTFAAPAVTTKDDTSAETIFNIINEDDLIPYYPLSSWGFKRYGTDVKIDVSNKSTIWASLTNIEYKTCSGSNIVDLAYEVSKNREGLYLFNDTVVYSENSDTEAAANTKINNLSQTLLGAGFSENYFKYKVNNNSSNTSSYKINAYVCPAFLMESLAGLITTDNYWTYIIEITYKPIDLTKIPSYKNLLNFMLEKYTNSSMVHAHCTYAYYAAILGYKIPSSSADVEYDLSSNSYIAKTAGIGNVITYYYVDDVWTLDKPIAAGTYNVGFSIEANENYEAFGSASDVKTESPIKTYTISPAVPEDNRINMFKLPVTGIDY